ncbi:MAG TPA: hypothetical protein VLQ48_16675 [Chloroflexia bacterium]|nr:hypothetical protein [Chloroflexia bacterium]
MLIIDISGVVTKDGEAKLTIQVPPDVPPGEHRFRVVLIDQASAEGARTLHIPPIHIDQWPEGLSLSREDMYGDWGR